MGNSKGIIFSGFPQDAHFRNGNLSFWIHKADTGIGKAKHDTFSDPRFVENRKTLGLIDFSLFGKGTIGSA